MLQVRQFVIIKVIKVFLSVIVSRQKIIQINTEKIQIRKKIFNIIICEIILDRRFIITNRL